MGRIEHYNDPNAPRANSLVPAASAVIFDDDGRILLHRRADNGLWSLPGGAMEIGETIGQCIVREVQEETGLVVDVLALVGVYSDPNHVIEYTDGEVRQQFSICFKGRPIGGALVVSSESTELRWVDPTTLGQLDIQASISLRIDDALAAHPRAAGIERLGRSPLVTGPIATLPTWKTAGVPCSEQASLLSASRAS
jgi:mutator protein MutT